MKNLLIYTNPKKKFDPVGLRLAKIQIDNSLSLGWKVRDIVLVANFPFKYNGVSSLVVADNLHYPSDIKASKLPVILFLLKNKLLNPRSLYWCHDIDAYEVNKISESELGLSSFDLGLVHYFYKQEWSFGSFFFRTSAFDIFELLDSQARSHPHQTRNNEKTLTRLIRDGLVDKKRFKKLNVTYNIMKRCLSTVYREAKKPIKVVHFYPYDQDSMMPDTGLNMFMYGKNRLKIPLLTDRLKAIFHKNGIK